MREKRQKGCREAEIIPYELDAGNSAERILSRQGDRRSLGRPGFRQKRPDPAGIKETWRS